MNRYKNRKNLWKPGWYGMQSGSGKWEDERNSYPPQTTLDISVKYEVMRFSPPTEAKRLTFSYAQHILNVWFVVARGPSRWIWYMNIINWYAKASKSVCYLPKRLELPQGGKYHQGIFELSSAIYIVIHNFVAIEAAWSYCHIDLFNYWGINPISSQCPTKTFAPDNGHPFSIYSGKGVSHAPQAVLAHGTPALDGCDCKSLWNPNLGVATILTRTHLCAYFRLVDKQIVPNVLTVYYIFKPIIIISSSNAENSNIQCHGFSGTISYGGIISLLLLK